MAGSFADSTVSARRKAVNPAQGPGPPSACHPRLLEHLRSHLRPVKSLTNNGNKAVVRSPEKASVGGSTPSLATIFLLNLASVCSAFWFRLVPISIYPETQTAEFVHDFLLRLGNKLLVDVEGGACSRVPHLAAVRNRYVGHGKLQSINVRSVGRILLQMTKVRGLQPLHPHLLRHACATHMLDNGCPLDVIAEVLGHDNLDVTAHRSQVSTQLMMEAYNSAHPFAKISKKRSNQNPMSILRLKQPGLCQNNGDAGSPRCHRRPNCM